MKPLHLFLSAVVAVAVAAPALAFDVDKKAVADTVAAFKKQQPASVKLFKSAYGYALYPTVTRGAFGVGAAYAEGGVYKGGKLVAKTSLTAVTVGLGAGGESYSQVIFFKDKASFDRFVEGKVEFGARANAVFLDRGVSGEPPYVDGVLILAQTKAGLMADASVGGQKFTFEKL
jgi:lipid-binding SYLF domain-containing protein